MKKVFLRLLLLVLVVAVPLQGQASALAPCCARAQLASVSPHLNLPCHKATATGGTHHRDGAFVTLGHCKVCACACLAALPTAYRVVALPLQSSDMRSHQSLLLNSFIPSGLERPPKFLIKFPV